MKNPCQSLPPSLYVIHLHKHIWTMSCLRTSFSSVTYNYFHVGVHYLSNLSYYFRFLRYSHFYLVQKRFSPIFFERRTVPCVDVILLWYPLVSKSTSHPRFLMWPLTQGAMFSFQNLLGLFVCFFRPTYCASLNKYLRQITEESLLGTNGLPKQQSH